MNLVPKFLTPVYEQLNIPFDGFGPLSASHGIYFYCDLLGAESAQDIPNASFKECFSIPRHTQLNRFGQCCVSAE